MKTYEAYVYVSDFDNCDIIKKTITVTADNMTAAVIKAASEAPKILGGFSRVIEIAAIGRVYNDPRHKGDYTYLTDWREFFRS